jgi:pimeloyl-ACP methyl ester carboxylesterase
MDLLADDCAAVLNLLGVKEPAVVCGLSMGGYGCFRLYDRHPQLMRGLILAATRAGGDTEQGKANRDKAISDINQGGIQPVIDNMLPILLAPDTYQENPGLVQQVKGIMDQTSSDGMVSALQGMKERPNSTKMLGQIGVPTLIVHGVEDQIIPISESEIMHSEIQDSRLEKIPEAGHLLNLEQPEKFNRAVTEFIRSL